MDQSNKKIDFLAQEAKALKDGLTDAVRRLAFSEGITREAVSVLNINHMGADYVFGDNSAILAQRRVTSDENGFSFDTSALSAPT